ncbi:MAG TPA: HAMP domain-containing sensor histidine kinase, partial [bacterium]|nr:HAMP domain-containing sensor histidine kinase [bacterium]
GPDQQKFIEIMDRNAAYIQSMIERYLNLSKLEKGEIVPDYRQFEFIEEALLPVLHNLKIIIEKNKKTLIEDKEALKSKFIINSDLELIKVILNNLFSNAIKYSDDRGIIKYFVNYSDNNEYLILKVENSSIGLTDEETKNVFNKFGRLKNAITSKQKGTGLGLYNSREILKILKGSICCESEKGEYVRFVVEIPVNRK